MFFAQIVDSEYPFVSGTEGVVGDVLSTVMGIETPDCLSFFSSAVAFIVSASNDMLAVLEGPSRLPQILSNVDNLSAEHRDYIAKYVSSVGGAFCDHCRKTREEASVTNFFKCSNCRLAHYCSKECQKKAWAAGHNEHCRKVLCFNNGDLVTFRKFRQHATVVEKCTEDSNLLKCEIIKTKEGNVVDKRELIVDKKELRHIRPLH